jgi:hypothetical protein
MLRAALQDKLAKKDVEHSSWRRPVVIIPRASKELTARRDPASQKLSYETLDAAASAKKPSASPEE